MERLKRIFQCIDPSVQETPPFDNNRSKKLHNDSVTDQSVKKKEFYIQFAAQYKQQHLVALAESQAIFEKQKQYIGKCLQDINLKIEKIEQLQKQLSQSQQRGRDSEWVKFE
jgi:hypothetical protein